MFRWFKNYEDNIIDSYPITAPRRRHIQPVPAPRTQISEKRRAFKGFKRSFKIGLNSNRDPLVQLQNTRLAISRLFGTLLSNMKCYKFSAVLSKLGIFCKAMRSTFTVFSSAIEASIKGYATRKLRCGSAAIKKGSRLTRLLPHAKISH